jgi:hypothetical protein
VTAQRAGQNNIWTTAAKRGGAIFVALSAVVLPAVDFTDSVWSNLAKLFVVLSVVAVMIVSMSKKWKGGIVWLRTGIAFVIAATIGLIAYTSLRSAWLVPFAGTSFVSGSPYFTPPTKKWLDANPGITTDAAIINKFTPSGISEIWDAPVVRLRTAVLIGLYVGTIELLALAVLCLIQGYDVSVSQAAHQNAVASPE